MKRPRGLKPGEHTSPSGRVFDSEGRLLRALQISSPNQDERPEGAAVSLLVVHNISLPPGEFGGPGVVDLFLNRLQFHTHPYYQGLRELEVSSHFLIRRDGELIQFVPCERRAWHAGASHWRGRERCNDFSVGIELEGSDEIAFTDAQYAELARLTRDLCARYPIQDIAGHSDIAPGRKTDPGPCFDWARFRALIAAELDR
jgi:N-acetyl-anhydromuramoyl-L-alanine amidase